MVTIVTPLFFTHTSLFIYFSPVPSPFKPGWMTSLFRLGFLYVFGISQHFSPELVRSGRTTPVSPVQLTARPKEKSSTTGPAVSYSPDSQLDVIARHRGKKKVVFKVINHNNISFSLITLLGIRVYSYVRSAAIQRGEDERLRGRQ